MDGIEVRAERVLPGVAQRLADRPSGVVDELGPGDLRRTRPTRRAPADCGDTSVIASKRVDRADRDLATTDELLADLGQPEDLRPRRRELATPAERLRRAVERVALVEHRLDSLGLLQGCELLARDVLRGAVGARALLVSDHNGRVGQVELAARRHAVIAGDELVARVCGSDDQRHEQTA